MPPSGTRRSCTSSMKLRMRKMPRPLPFRMFSGASGSAMLSGSKPAPWSRTRIIISGTLSRVVSKVTKTRLDVSWRFPCLIALITHSRMATPTQCAESSSRPMSRLTWFPTSSTKSTMSNVLVNSRRMVTGCMRSVAGMNTIPSIEGCQAEYRKICRMSASPTVTITPTRRVQGRLRVPGDKSISHRYALLAALSEGRSELTNYSRGADCHSTLACLRALGTEIAVSGDQVTLDGHGLHGFYAPRADLDAGNSGTTMRMLAGVLAGQPFVSRLIGDASLSRRPMRRVIEPLAQMGARIDATDGHAPLTVHGTTLHAV